LFALPPSMRHFFQSFAYLFEAVMCVNLSFGVCYFLSQLCAFRISVMFQCLLISCPRSSLPLSALDSIYPSICWSMLFKCSNCVQWLDWWHSCSVEQKRTKSTNLSFSAWNIQWKCVEVWEGRFVERKRKSERKVEQLHPWWISKDFRYCSLIMFRSVTFVYHSIT